MTLKKYNDGNCFWIMGSISAYGCYFGLNDHCCVETNENMHVTQLLMCQYDCYSGRLDENYCVKVHMCVRSGQYCIFCAFQEDLVVLNILIFL